MIEYLALAMLLLIAGIVGIKFWNILNAAKFYDPKFIWIGLVIGLFAWGIYLVCTMTAIQSTSVITDGTVEGTFTQTSNQYLILTNLMIIVNWFIGFVIALSVIEFITSISISLSPKGFVKKNKSN